MKKKSSAFLQICRQAIQLNDRPVPYLKAFIAGLSATIPVLIGIFFENFHNGLIAGLGGFAFLYVFRMPYIHRLKKIIFITIGLSLCAFLGSVLATSPILIAVSIAIISALMIFLFCALNITGPSAIFMVLVFAVASEMPITDFYGAVERSALVASGGLLSLFFAVFGWFFDPHKPEREIIQILYKDLAFLLKTVGKPEFKDKHSNFIQMLDDANQVLQNSYINWYQSAEFKKLFFLNKRANRIWILLGENFGNSNESISYEIIKSIDLINESIINFSTVTLNIKNFYPEEQCLVNQLIRIEKIINSSQLPKLEFPSIRLPTFQILVNSLNFHSISFLSSLSIGIITLISALVAYSFDFDRSFWIPLSTISVISGLTMMATLHRSLQRGFGTIIGVIIGSVLLYFEPSEYLIAFYIFFFCMMSEIFIVKNYGLTALCFTPSALIIAFSSTNTPASSLYFAQVRIIDVFIGIVIGIIGILIITRNSSSRYFHRNMAELIRIQSRLSYVVFKENLTEKKLLLELYFYPMKIRLNNLNVLYQTMLGEIPIPEKILKEYWQFFNELKKLSYLLERVCFSKEHVTLSEIELSKLLLIYEQLANGLELDEKIKFIYSPTLSKFPLLNQQINLIQSTFIDRNKIL